MDLVRENEQIKQKFKEVSTGWFVDLYVFGTRLENLMLAFGTFGQSLSQMETRCSSLYDEKISEQNKKKTLEQLVKQQTDALKKFNAKFQEQQSKIRMYESQRDTTYSTNFSEQQQRMNPNNLQPAGVFHPPQHRQSEMARGQKAITTYNPTGPFHQTGYRG